MGTVNNKQFTFIIFPGSFSSCSKNPAVRGISLFIVLNKQKKQCKNIYGVEQTGFLSKKLHIYGTRGPLL